MADAAGLEHPHYLQNNSSVDSFAPEFVALLLRLKQYALRLTRNPAVADDLAQEAVVRGMEHIHLWRQRTDLRAWLFTILRNRYVSDVRRAARHSAWARSTYAERPAACPPRQVERLQLRDLERALAQLPDGAKDGGDAGRAERGRYYAVASQLGVPVGTVRSRLLRGRRRLYELIDSAPPPQSAQS